jgi:hypothetical protein
MGQEFMLEAGEVASPRRPILDHPQAVVSDGDERKQLEQWRKELTGYLAEAKGIADDDPDEAMRWMAATSARVCEIRDQSWDLRSPKAAQLRSRHIDPFVQEIDRQFKIASRRFATAEHELRMTRGMT